MSTSRGKRIAAIIGFLVAVGLLWRQVFVMTGILWWQAPRAAERPAPPPPAQFKQVPTDWVDLEAYQKANPMWQLW